MYSAWLEKVPNLQDSAVCGHGLFFMQYSCCVFLTYVLYGLFWFNFPGGSDWSTIVTHHCCRALPGWSAGGLVWLNYFSGSFLTKYWFVPLLLCTSNAQFGWGVIMQHCCGAFPGYRVWGFRVALVWWIIFGAWLPCTNLDGCFWCTILKEYLFGWNNLVGHFQGIIVIHSMLLLCVFEVQLFMEKCCALLLLCISRAMNLVNYCGWAIFGYF